MNKANIHIKKKIDEAAEAPLTNGPRPWYETHKHREVLIGASAQDSGAAAAVDIDALLHHHEPLNDDDKAEIRSMHAELLALRAGATQAGALQAVREAAQAAFDAYRPKYVGRFGILDDGPIDKEMTALKDALAATQPNAAPAAEVVATVPVLPDWWAWFIQNICELPDRNSPEDEPEAMVATPDELENCAIRAMERLAAPGAAIDAREQDVQLLALVANLAAVVRVQNGNKHEDINTLLAHADSALASRSEAPEARPNAAKVHVEAVATVVERADGLELDWLVEGGIAALATGVTLYMADSPITDDDGAGAVRLA